MYYADTDMLKDPFRQIFGRRLVVGNGFRCLNGFMHLRKSETDLPRFQSHPGQFVIHGLAIQGLR